LILILTRYVVSFIAYSKQYFYLLFVEIFSAGYKRLFLIVNYRMEWSLLQFSLYFLIGAKGTLIPLTLAIHFLFPSFFVVTSKVWPITYIDLSSPAATLTAAKSSSISSTLHARFKAKRLWY